MSVRNKSSDGNFTAPALKLYVTFCNAVLKFLDRRSIFCADTSPDLVCHTISYLRVVVHYHHMDNTRTWSMPLLCAGVHYLGSIYQHLSGFIAE